MTLAKQFHKFVIAAPAWLPQIHRSLSNSICGTSEGIIGSLKTILSDRAPVTYGTCVIPSKDFGLFYGKADSGSTARHIYLHNASAAEAELLTRACQAATFGLNKQDVYDETYRRAGKMDVDDFAAKFDVERSGILARVKNDLLDGRSSARAVECELYKLNVYGEGGFFKPHKDTPRSGKMFGSLVIVFPVAHTGGELILRHGGKEWAFDAGKELAATARPSVGYVAFYSDVEHEVAPVQSGHRVTLTYNLYFGDNSDNDQTTLPESEAAVHQEKEFKKGLEQLLADPLFLPYGGIIGFGLQHEYPISAKTVAASFAGRLKGNDGLIERVCNQLGVPIEPKILSRTWDVDRKRDRGYPDPEMEVLTDAVVDWSEEQEVPDSDMVEMLTERGAIFLPHLKDGRIDATVYDEEKDGHVPVPTTDIHWITEVTNSKHNTVKTEYVIYGNQPYLDHMYGTICLIAYVGPPENRRLS
ncbi:uncharacterized protein LOC129584058 [Paramacrobiotus metropolitanus]|uniref:uncharacterized protein LOC129584058 n=1 Tax=Paramacrobiotus metropolitanus TaxID=2943436 RepID=UPI0024463475|nr:uncharacterized protein LOC129584058 [Paramacrobiotus metropolitanus]